MPEPNVKAAVVEMAAASLIFVLFLLGVNELKELGFRPNAWFLILVLPFVGAGMVASPRMHPKLQEKRWLGYGMSALGLAGFLPLFAAARIDTNPLPFTIACITALVVAIVTDSMEKGQGAAPVVKAVTLVPLMLLSVYRL